MVLTTILAFELVLHAWKWSLPKALGIRNLRYLTNNPKKIVGIEGYGLRVVERVPLEVPPTEENRQYLVTKREKTAPAALSA